jgi:hypothetical protein
MWKGFPVSDSPEKPLQSAKETPKKPYKTPRLEVYGDLHKLTKMMGNQNRDGGTGFNHGTR